MTFETPQTLCKSLVRCRIDTPYYSYKNKDTGINYKAAVARRCVPVLEM